MVARFCRTWCGPSIFLCLFFPFSIFHLFALYFPLSHAFLKIASIQFKPSILEIIQREMEGERKSTRGTNEKSFYTFFLFDLERKEKIHVKHGILFCDFSWTNGILFRITIHLVYGWVSISTPKIRFISYCASATNIYYLFFRC